MTLEEIGMQKQPDGSELPLPPVILGHLGNDPKKKTVCIYGHLDVQPAKIVSFCCFYLCSGYFFIFVVFIYTN